MRVLMVTAELWPLAKVGGLADMVGSLAGALGRAGHDVRCAIPRYHDLVERIPPGLRETGSREVSFVVRHGRVSARVSRIEGDGLPSPVDLVAHDTFDRPGVYTDPATRRPYEDNGLRWAIFCRAVHAALESDGWVPDAVPSTPSGLPTGELPPGVGASLGPEFAQRELDGIERLCADEVVAGVGGDDRPAALGEAQHLERAGQRVEQPGVADTFARVDGKLLRPIESRR